MFYLFLIGFINAETKSGAKKRAGHSPEETGNTGAAKRMERAARLTGTRARTEAMG
jgi:hypothetical protein